jgi:putative lipoprotein
MIEQSHTYAVAAKLILQGKVVFRSDTVHPVLTRGAGNTVEVLMVRSAAADGAQPRLPDEAGGHEASGDLDALVGPTWVAEDIQRRGVIDFLQSHITFTAEGQAHGFGGCNNFTGGYRVEGATLELGPLASTKKACPPAIMNQEASFYAALGETRGYQFENGLLFLLDAQGAPVMRLWRRD